MPDIYLRSVPSDANNGDVRLYDPTVANAITGTLNKTLGVLTLSSSGQVVVTGSLNKTLGALTLSSTAQVKIAGTLSKTLGALSLSSTGQLIITAVLNKTLAPLTLSSTATIGGAAGPAIPLIGTGARNHYYDYHDTDDMKLSIILAQQLKEQTATALSVQITNARILEALKDLKNQPPLSVPVIYDVPDAPAKTQGRQNMVSNKQASFAKTKQERDMENKRQALLDNLARGRQTRMNNLKNRKK